MHRSRAINAVGAVLTGVVLVVVLVTKFTHGAWIVVIAMPVLFLLMRGIRRHYDRVAAELRPDAGRRHAAQPRPRHRAGLPAAHARRCGRSPSPAPPARTR